MWQGIPGPPRWQPGKPSIDRRVAETTRTVVEAERSLCHELVLYTNLQITGQVGRAESVEATIRWDAQLSHLLRNIQTHRLIVNPAPIKTITYSDFDSRGKSTINTGEAVSLAGASH